MTINEVENNVIPAIEAAAEGVAEAWRADRDKYKAVYDAVKDMMHDINIFYAKHREPDNKYIAALRAALEKADQ